MYGLNFGAKINRNRNPFHILILGPKLILRTLCDTSTSTPIPTKITFYFD